MNPCSFHDVNGLFEQTSPTCSSLFRPADGGLNWAPTTGEKKFTLLYNYSLLTVSLPH